MLKAVIMGAPASGKGTIAARIVKNFDVVHISVGDILRREMKEGTHVGKGAKEHVDAGHLVPDELIFDLVTSELKKAETKNWLLDGFPRNRAQATKLEELSHVNYAIHLVVSSATIIERVKGRWVHVNSGRVYNDKFNAPKKPGIDDVTGEPLVQREDDKPEAVLKRIKLYEDMIEPVLKFYQEKKVLHNFEGDTSDEIWTRLSAALSDIVKKGDRKPSQ